MLGKRRRIRYLKTTTFNMIHLINQVQEKKTLCQALINTDKKLQKLTLDVLERDMKIKDLEKKLKNRVCDDDIKSSFLLQLNAARRRNQNIDPHHRTWTFEDKLLSLNIQKRGVQAFEFLHQQEPTCFPSERTCQRMFAELSMGVGINDDYFEALGKKVATMDPRARYCMLGIDEVAIKPIPVYDSAADKIFGLWR